MTQIERIRHMEKILDEASAAVRAFSAALDRYESLLPAIDELTAYYESPLWRQDFEDDCAGKLLENLKRGVLSEDAVYNLLSDIHELHEQYKLISLPKRN